MTARHRLAGWLIWGLRLIAAGILLQTLYFKFTGAPESVYIFSKLGLEPAGRIGSGIAELIASILILWPRMSFLGAGLALGVMSGAIFSHLTKLGIVVQSDGGLLFGMAITVWLSCAVLIWDARWEIIRIVQKTRGPREASG